MTFFQRSWEFKDGLCSEGAKVNFTKATDSIVKWSCSTQVRPEHSLTV